MLNDPRLNQINSFLKSSAKSKGLNYTEIAKRLGVSEPTVKRWMRGEGISIQQWLRLINAIDIRVSDVASALDEPALGQFEYSEKQERILAETDGLLAFFHLLLLGRTPVEIQQHYKLTKNSISFYLRLLDDIGLVVWTKGMTCKLKVNGEPKWKKNGPLAKRFREQLINDFIWARRNQDCFRLGVYELTTDDYDQLTKKIAQVFESAKNFEKKAKILKLRAKTVCIGTCLDLYVPKFLFSVPNSKGEKKR